jgi:hydrogenase nickel incorporation protein HypA/HybF
MHEMSLTEGILDIIHDESRRRGFSKVRMVRVEVGAIGQVEPDSLAFCFDAVTRGTLAEGATLDIVTVAGEGWCFDCEKSTPLAERFDACAGCGGHRVQMTAGDELRVKELEVE